MFETEMVKTSYNKIAASYYSHRDLNKFNGELDKFIDLLPKNGHILDVGCGAGIPTGKYLVSRGFPEWSANHPLKSKRHSHVCL